MAGGAEGRFELSHTNEVTRQLRNLAETAIELGFKKQYLSALRLISEKLQTMPMEWGDPEYHPKRKGACVCHVACDPLFVRYVVFEPERKVMLLKVQALPLSPLE